MGLSSKQVSRSGIDWNQTLLQDQKLDLPKPPPLMRKQQQQQIQQSQQSSSSSSEPLKCPRCDSTNTKFCYYNNYNKSQPRHFCRTCKRHWTKGGTLRNVPVGGGRKNKRVKKSSTPNISSSAAVAAAATSGMVIQSSLPRPSNLPLPPSSSASLFQSLIHPPPSSHPSLLLTHHQNLMNPRNLQSKDFGIGNCTSSFLTSTLPLLPHQNQSFMFPFSSSSSSFETNPCSVVSTSLRSSSVYNSNNYGHELKTMEEPTPIQTQTQPWEIPSTSVVGNTEMSNYWTWEDLDSLVSTDLNVPWDDSDLKP